MSEEPDEIALLGRLTHLVRLPEDVGQRADVVAGRRLAGVSRRVVRKMALEGRLLVDGDPAPPSRRVGFGECIELWWERHAEPAEDVLTILEQTPRFVYAHKPPGMHTHRLRPDDPPALADLIVARFPECRAAAPDEREGGAIHRLDRGTSGVVAFARSPASYRAARAAFSAQRVGKRYLAIVDGAWPPEAPPGWGYCVRPLSAGSGEVTLAGVDAAVAAMLARHGLAPFDGAPVELAAPLGLGARRGLVSVRPDGQPARTVIAPLAWVERRGLVALELPTGRRHQARVHLAWAGLPIVGDRRYHPAPAAGRRLHLHAFALNLQRVDADERTVIDPVDPGLLASLTRGEAGERGRRDDADDSR